MGRRAEKTAATREAIFQAAARVVGRVGYAKASITRIAEEAGVSSGLIYQYFENQQDLFDKLLPHVGEEMLQHISEKAARAPSVHDRERMGLEANFDYLSEKPAIHRVLNEAAFVAPRTHFAYLERMIDGYHRSLSRGRKDGEIRAYSDNELRTLAVMLIGAREYLLEYFAADGTTIHKLPEGVKETYLKAVFAMLSAEPPAEDVPPTGSEPRREDGRQ